MSLCCHCHGEEAQRQELVWSTLTELDTAAEQHGAGNTASRRGVHTHTALCKDTRAHFSLLLPHSSALAIAAVTTCNWGLQQAVPKLPA